MEGSGKMVVAVVGVNFQIGIIFLLLGIYGEKEGDKLDGKEDVLFQLSLIKVSQDEFEEINFDEEKDFDINGKDKKDKQEKFVFQGKLIKLVVSIGWFGVVVVFFIIIVMVL